MAPERKEEAAGPVTTGWTPVVVGAGLVTLDIVLNGDPHRPIGHWAGGTCGNVLAALAFLGWSAFPVARLGEDQAAEMVLADLATRGVRTDLLERESGQRTTKIVQRIFAEAGKVRHRFAFECPACTSSFARYRAPRLDRLDAVLQAVPAPRVFFFDRISPMILRLAKAYRSAGALVVFEPGKIGDPETFAQAVRMSHVLKYSAERLGNALDGVGGLEKIIGGEQPALEIETQGATGLRYRQAIPGQAVSRWHRQAAYPIPHLRDTAGAGDWCTAGLLYALLGEEPSEIGEILRPDAVRAALAWSQALSAISCMFEGPRSVSYALSREAVLQTASGIATERHAQGPAFASPRSTLPNNHRYKCSTCLAEA